MNKDAGEEPLELAIDVAPAYAGFFAAFQKRIMQAARYLAKHMVDSIVAAIAAVAVSLQLTGMYFVKEAQRAEEQTRLAQQAAQVAQQAAKNARRGQADQAATVVDQVQRAHERYDPYPYTSPYQYAVYEVAGRPAFTHLLKPGRGWLFVRSHDVVCAVGQVYENAEFIGVVLNPVGQVPEVVWQLEVHIGQLELMEWSLSMADLVIVLTRHGEKRKRYAAVGSVQDGHLKATLSTRDFKQFLDDFGAAHQVHAEVTTKTSAEDTLYTLPIDLKGSQRAVTIGRRACRVVLSEWT